MLNREQIEANAKTYLEQIYLVLDRDRTEVRRNSEWLGKMAAADVLRLMAKATLQQVLQREDFAERMKAGIPIGAHEILYPFNQAYDSVEIQADVEIGGTDQLFNLLFGREIQKAYGQQPQDVAVFPLMEGTDGVQKMSKSLNNYIGISEPPSEIYGKVMSISDPLSAKYLRYVSGLSKDLQEELLRLRPLDTKAALAKQLVRRLHGEQAAEQAEADFNRRFRRREMPEEIPEFATTFPTWLVETIVAAGLAKTKSEARRLLSQNGVKLNGDVYVSDVPIRPNDVIQVGKRRFVKVVVK